MKVQFFIISLIFILKGYSQNVVPNKSIFDKEVELSIDYLRTTMCQYKGLDLEIDTNDFLSYKVMVNHKLNDVYSVTIDDFIPKMEFSNFETLNALFYDFIKEQKYNLECDLEMSNPQINNLNYISELAEKYKPKIDKAKADLYMNPQDNMVYYKDISIPNENLEIINRCIILLSPVFEGYVINLSKEYYYPREVQLAQLNTTFNDTLFFKTKSLSSEIQEIEIYVYSDSSEINNALTEINKIENRESNIDKLEMFNNIRYNIEKASGKIIRIIINSGMNSSSDKYEMNIDYKIKYGS